MWPTAWRNVASSSPSAIITESPMRGIGILPKGSPGCSVCLALPNLLNLPHLSLPLTNAI
jgi:hypothetical protein